MNKDNIFFIVALACLFQATDVSAMRAARQAAAAAKRAERQGVSSEQLQEIRKQTQKSMPSNGENYSLALKKAFEKAGGKGEATPPPRKLTSRALPALLDLSENQGKTVTEVENQIVEWLRSNIRTADNNAIYSFVETLEDESRSNIIDRDIRLIKCVISYADTLKNKKRRQEEISAQLERNEANVPDITKEIEDISRAKKAFIDNPDYQLILSLSNQEIINNM